MVAHTAQKDRQISAAQQDGYFHALLISRVLSRAA